MTAPGGGPPGGGRALKVKVKTSRGRKLSSKLWLQRQLNDPYVKAAQAEGWRSRAAFKLIELDDKAHLLKPGMAIVDLGCAPGGWLQVASMRVKSVGGRGRVVGIDYLHVDPVEGCEVLQADFTDPGVDATLKAMLGGPADVVLSDMAPPTIGHRQSDHLRIMGLLEEAVAFAGDVLKPGGAFVAKVFQGGAAGDLLTLLKRDYASVKHVKPPASRKDSSELYVVATGFRGGEAAP